MLLGMARAIIARNETQKNQAELRSKDVEKEDVEPNGTTGLIREKRAEELEDVRTKETTRSMAEERLDEETLTTPKKATLDESFLKGLAESLEKTRKNNERAAEELCRTEEMLESIRRAREAEEAESVARNAARRMPCVELTKPETKCRREPEGGDASGSSTPEKPKLSQPAESAA